MKCIKRLTEQRNRIQEWLINSNSWQRHPQMYRFVENTWKRYVENIENHEGKKLNDCGFHSAFALKPIPRSVYMAK